MVFKKAICRKKKHIASTLFMNNHVEERITEWILVER